MSAKKTTQRQGFKTSEFIVYPAHGVGQIVAIESSSWKTFGLIAPTRIPRSAGCFANLGVVVDAVPRYVEGHRGRHACQAVDQGGIGDFSYGSRAAAGFLNTLNRVPVLPYAHDGVSIHCWRSSCFTSSLDFIRTSPRAFNHLKARHEPAERHLPLGAEPAKKQ